MKIGQFWGRILSSKDSFSSKRLVTLIVSLHFLLASFAILYFAFYVIFFLPKGKIEPDLMELLKGVLEYDFYIILSGLGFISMDNFGTVLIEKAKAKAGVENYTNDNQDIPFPTPPPTTDPNSTESNIQE